MLLQLHGRHLKALARAREPGPVLARVRTSLAGKPSSREVLLTDGRGPLPDGFRGYLVRSLVDPGDCHDVYLLGPEFGYVAEGDIVRINPERCSMAVLYRRSSAYNSLLVTERCDNYCVMCSQPPKARVDDWIVDELLEIIPLMSLGTREIGITGGEPALLGDRLLTLLECLKSTLPQTAVHVLSNGRAFSDESFARALGAVYHHDLILGIPLYSAVPEEHDYIVQRRGAYEQTVRGILNLKRFGVRVELRFVIHAETYTFLPEFARFVARNLLFVDHVALMGLELMGFARSNLDALWIDPLDYQPELVEAALRLERAGLATSVYNHQLCVLDSRVHHLAQRSISDWKHRYFEACTDCARQDECGGFFASNSRRRSRGITAFTADPVFQPPNEVKE